VWRRAEAAGIELTAGREAKGYKRLSPERRAKIDESAARQSAGDARRNSARRRRQPRNGKPDRAAEPTGPSSHASSLGFAPGIGAALLQKRKPRRGNTGAFGSDDRQSGGFDRPWIANSIDRRSCRFKIGVAQDPSRRGNRLDQARIIILDVADARADGPADHVIGRVGGPTAP
jgi:hypothetical protein